jgi:hypothetical protein
MALFRELRPKHLVFGLLSLVPGPDDPIPLVLVRDVDLLSGSCPPRSSSGSAYLPRRKKRVETRIASPGFQLRSTDGVAPAEARIGLPGATLEGAFKYFRPLRSTIIASPPTISDSKIFFFSIDLTFPVFRA